MKLLFLIALISSSLLSMEDASSTDTHAQEEQTDEDPTSSALCTGVLASLCTLTACFHPLESSCCTALFWTGCACAACTQSKFCNES